MAMPVDPVRRKLDKPAICVSGLAVAVAIAEDPGANAQQRRVASDFREAAAYAGKRILISSPVQQRFRQLAVEKRVGPARR